MAKFCKIQFCCSVFLLFTPMLCLSSFFLFTSPFLFRFFPFLFLFSFCLSFSFFSFFFIHFSHFHFLVFLWFSWLIWVQASREMQCKTLQSQLSGVYYYNCLWSHLWGSFLTTFMSQSIFFYVGVIVLPLSTQVSMKACAWLFDTFINIVSGVNAI